MSLKKILLTLFFSLITSVANAQLMSPEIHLQLVKLTLDKFIKLTDKRKDNCTIPKLEFGKLTAPNGKSFELSIVSEDKANELFNKMASQKHIPFKYPEDGCYARAHEMSRLLEADGIIAGKGFIEGKLRVKTENSPHGYVDWWYHVAPVVLVRKGDKVEPYIIDPSIFDRAVPEEEWYKIQLQHPEAAKEATYNTNRFVYMPSSKDKSESHYRKKDIESAKETMQTYLEIQNQRLREKKKQSQRSSK